VAQFALRSASPGSWPAGPAPPRPSDSSARVAADLACRRRQHARGRHDGDGGHRAVAADPDRGAHGAQLLGRLSGIATLTARYVAAAHARNPAVQVLDTRKTTPGLRALEKAAVKAGGGLITVPACRRPCWSRTTTCRDHHHRGGSPAPRPVARPPGADRVRRARAVVEAARAGRMPCSSTTWTRRRGGGVRRHGPRRPARS